VNLLITGAWQSAKASASALETMGHSVCFLQNERDPLPCDPAWVEGVIMSGLFLYHPIESMPNLRYVQLTSAGLDRVPMDYILAHGIEIHNARGVYDAPMAEYAVCGVLQLYKQAAAFFESQRAHRWEKRRDLKELCGKTVLIVGCGSIGTTCARRFRAFDTTVIGVNRTVRQDPAYDAIYAIDQLDRLLPTADVVVLTLPLTEQTRGMFDAARLGRMRSDAILVNLARGAIVDADALARAEIGGAVLDVFETEPLPQTSPLWDKPNFILTPHNSFTGDGNPARMDALIFRNLRRE